MARLEVEEVGACPTPAERCADLPAEQAAPLVEAAETKAQPALAELAVQRDGGPAIGRAIGTDGDVAVDLAGLAREGQPGNAEVTAKRHGGAALRIEAGAAGAVAGDQEGAGAGSGQAPLHRLGAFGKAEGKRGLVVDPGNGRAGDQPCLALVVGADVGALHEDPGGGAALGDGHGDAEAAGGRPADLDRAVERAAQRCGLRRAADGPGKVDRISAAVAIEDDRTDALDHRVAGRSRALRSAAAAAADDDAGPGQRGGPDRGEGAGNVEAAAAVDGIGAGRAEVVGAAEQDVDDRSAGQVGKGRGEQRDRARDGGRGKAGAAVAHGLVEVVDGADARAERAEEIVRAGSRAVAEVAQFVGADQRKARVAHADRTRDDHVGREARGGHGRKGVGVRAESGVLAVVAGRDDDHHAGIDGPVQRTDEGGAGGRAAQRHVDHPGSGGDRCVDPARDARVAELASPILAGGGAAALRVGAQRDDDAVEGDSVDHAAVAGGANHRGDGGAMAILVGQRAPT